MGSPASEGSVREETSYRHDLDIGDSSSQLLSGTRTLQHAPALPSRSLETLAFSPLAADPADCLVAVPSLLQGLKVVVGPLLAQAGVVLVVGLARGQPGHRERVVDRQLGVLHLALASSVELVKIFNVKTP